MKILGRASEDFENFENSKFFICGFGWVVGVLSPFFFLKFFKQFQKIKHFSYLGRFHTTKIHCNTITLNVLQNAKITHKGTKLQVLHRNTNTYWNTNEFLSCEND